MLISRKRGRFYHLDGQIAEFRLRGSLGTKNQEFARQLVHRIEKAMGDGADSKTWAEVRTLLPSPTYSRLAEVIGVRERAEPTWSDLRQLFRTCLDQRTTIGKIQTSTSVRYEATLREFEQFLSEEKITLLSHITKPVVEKFKSWRIARIKQKKFSRGGTGLVLDAAILHRIFAFAIETELIEKNPVRMEGRPGENPTNGAEPFTGAELSRMREHAGDDLLAFLLLRWTGLRGSDAVSITWPEVHFDRKEIDRVTQKRRKRVIIPIHPELLFCLEADCQKHSDIDRVLVNPVTGKSLSRPRLYARIIALGKRAGVANAHPHRFRDTLAVDMLLRGASPYDVAKLLGDTIETVERHYLPFVKELRERLRSLMENDLGLESSVTLASQPLKRIQ